MIHAENTSNDRSGSRSRFRSSYDSSSSRSGSRRPSFGRGRSFGSRPRGRGGSRKESINYDLYVKKATPVVEQKYEPTHKFTDFELHPKLKQNVVDRGFTHPTPIQDQAIKLILEGKDVVGIANTGTGKTAAFLLPLITKILKAGAQNEFESALIVVPTRELAQQIEEELRSFAQNLRLFSVCCVGGTDIRRQIARLSKPNHFVIGTPGRLMDLTKRKILKLHRFQYVVLDEADRMLDMGFIDDIKFLIERLPEKRQSLFFSATLDPALRPVMDEFLTDPITVSVRKNHTSDNVDQDIVVIERHQTKVDVLHDLLIKEDFKRVLIFGKTKHGVDSLAEELYSRGFSVEAIHGDKTQSRRQKALDLFKKGRTKILVATDVAARGLDIQDVSHVINYDIPENYDDYIHRIGRTGRGNKVGKALTFVGK
jgi:ATP-dependent RNA helicase RhlE